MERFIKYRDSDRELGAPVLVLKSDFRHDYITKTYPFYIAPWIHFASKPEQKRPIYIRFNLQDAISSGEILLLRQQGDSWEKVHFPIIPRSNVEPQGQFVDLKQHDSSFNVLDLHAVGATDQFDGRHDSGPHITELNPGCDTSRYYGELSQAMRNRLELKQEYTLFWPGGELRNWDWTDPDASSTVILPAATLATFNVQDDQIPWQRRDDLEINSALKQLNRSDTQGMFHACGVLSLEPLILMTEADRIPNTPQLTRTITASEIYFAESEDFAVVVTTTYEASDTDQRPITIFDNVRGEILEARRFALCEHTDQGLVEEATGYGCRFGLEEFWYELPVVVKDKDDGYEKEFYSLYPGESFTETVRLFRGDYPYNYYTCQVGQTYSYVFPGKVVQWWDWGTVQDHKGLNLHRYATNHDKRPTIVIPAARVDFTVVGNPSSG